MNEDLNKIKEAVENYADVINVPKIYFPTYGYSIDDAHPHIEVDGKGQMYYVKVERGQEIKRDFALDLNDLLYRIFSDIVFSMACNFEVNNRIAGEDVRRQIFAKELELLKNINLLWENRKKHEIRDILAMYPFHDKSDS